MKHFGANPEDVQALRKHLTDQAFANYDDHEAVIAAAIHYFSNYAETDIVSIVTELYHQEQAAALGADEASNSFN